MDEYLEIELQPLDEFDSMDIDIGTDECCSDYLDVEIGSLARVGGTTDYNDLENKPQINGVILEGNKTPQDLHITTSQLENNGDGSSPFATQEYVNIHGGKIDVIEVNGKAQEIVNKTVNLVIDKSTVGLENVDNTSDENKPVSILQQEAIATALNEAKLYVNEKTNTFVFRQDEAKDVWMIVHNLHKRPSVSVVDSGDNIVYGDVEYVSDDELTITFSAAFSGKAYLN